jgi:hypothetical protein
MKISEYRNEDALDLLADIIAPASAIIADPNFQKKVQTEPKLTIVMYVLKNHKRSIVEILARLEGKTVKEYDANIVQMTKSLLEILNDEELKDFFLSQGQMTDGAFSGSAMESTEETGV